MANADNTISDDLSDDLVARYLLGQLSQAQAEALEQQFMASDDVHDFVSAVEAELFEDYATGTMSERRRALFEARYAGRADVSDRLRLFTALTRASEAESRGRLASAPERTGWSWLRRFRAPLAAAAVAACVVLLWLAVRAGPGAGGPELAALDLELAPIRVRAPADVPVAPPDRPLVLRLAVDPDDAHRHYELAVEVAGARRVLAPRVEHGEPVIARVPPRALPPGDYELELVGLGPDGRREVIAYYALRVARRVSQ